MDNNNLYFAMLPKEAKDKEAILKKLPDDYKGVYSVRISEYPGCVPAQFTKDINTFSLLKNPYAAKAVYEVTKANAEDSAIAVVKLGEQEFAAEYQDPATMVTSVVKLARDGRVFATKVKPGNKFDANIDLTSNHRDDSVLAPIYACLFYLLEETDYLSPDQNEELTDAFDTATEPGWGKTKVAAVHYLHNVLNGYVTSQTSPGFVFMHTGPNLTDSLSINDISEFKSRLNGTLMCGKPKYIGDENMESVADKPKTFKEVYARKEFRMYAARRTWTPAEKALIPIFDNDTPVMEPVIRICERIVRSTGCKRPERNFLWRGCTSCGKSTGADMVAAILGMPRLAPLTCRTDLESNECISQWVPRNSRTRNGKMPKINLENAAADPFGEWIRLTGKAPDKEVTITDVYEMWAANQESSDGSIRYDLVESTYVQALKMGYLVEVQEISRVREPGVLVALNEYDRPGAKIPLADGSFCSRHPDAVVIYTDNVGYVSCREVDPSVTRRFDQVYTTEALKKEEVIQRVQFNTDLHDAKVIESLYDITTELKKHLQSEDIRHCELSVTEIERWAQTLVTDGMTEDVFRDSFYSAVLNKCSPDYSEIQEIKNWISDKGLLKMPA